MKTLGHVKIEGNGDKYGYIKSQGDATPVKNEYIRIVIEIQIKKV